MAHTYSTKFLWVAALYFLSSCSAIAGEPIWKPSDYYAPYQEHGYLWENNSIGIDSAVPSPWKPIRFDSTTQTAATQVSEIVLDGAIFPKRIMAKGKNILSRPIELKLASQNREYSIGQNNLVVKSSASEQVSFQSIEEFDGLLTTISMDLDYDGFMLFTVDIASDNKAKISNLALDLELNTGDSGVLSNYLTYDYVKQKFDRKTLDGSVRKVEGTTQYKFSPLVSIETDKFGLEWISETNSNYSLLSDEDAVSVFKTPSGSGLKITMVNKPLLVNNSVTFQFAIFPIPSRPEKRTNSFMVSKHGGKAYKKSFEDYCCISPIYFGNRRRIPFEITGLPNLSLATEDQKLIEKELKLINGVGHGYAPYTSMHILSTQVKELAHYGKLWGASAARPGTWGGRLTRTATMQPVAYQHKSLADFIIHKHIEAIRSQSLKAMYHDIAGMTSLSSTMTRVLTSKQIKNGTVYYPFFGLREFAKRYWKATKEVAPQLEIIWHTGAILPKAISTYTDFVVFGESFHFMFSDSTVNEEFPVYNPDYFALNQNLFEGPLNQKNGFTYMVLPELIRKDQPEVDRDTLNRQTRSLLGFSLLKNYPVWSTRLSFPVHYELLKHIDRFGGLANAEFSTSAITIAPDNGLMQLGVYKKNSERFVVAFSQLERTLDLDLVDSVVRQKLGEVLIRVDSSDEQGLQPFDYVLYMSK